MKTGYKVSDVMTHVPVFVKPNATLEKCAIEMRDKKVGTIIIKEGDSLLGVLSERDIVRKVVAEAKKFLEKGKNTSNIKVSEIMTKDLITVDPNKDIFEALNMMKEFDIRHLPVIHEKKLVGMLTMKDILKIEPQLFEILVEKIKLREESRKPINRIIKDEGICELCGNYVEKLEYKAGSLVCLSCIKHF
jgi:CBS domain-containing protein